MYHVSPTMLCADPLDLRAEVKKAEACGVDWLHVDVMDGNFVPNFAIGTETIRGLKKESKLPVYCHMMCTKPLDFIAPYAGLGVDYYCFHYETTNTPFRVAQAVRNAGMKPGAALNPATPVSVLKDLIPYIDTVTLMAIEPGFSGQKFFPHTYDKVRELKAMIGSRNVLIEVDGGADFEISRKLVEAGCDVVVGGAFTLFDKGGTFEENHARYMKAMEGL